MQGCMVDLQRYRTTSGQEKETSRNQGSIFLGNSYNRNNVNALIQFRRKVSSSILKDDISSRTDTSIFTLIAPMLLDQSNETSLVLPALKATSHLLPQSTVSEIKVSILVVVTEQMSDHT